MAIHDAISLRISNATPGENPVSSKKPGFWRGPVRVDLKTPSNTFPPDERPASSG
jgi:hypothetical protein